MTVFLGCRLAMADSELDVAYARAAQVKEPLLVLVGESGQSHANDSALALFESPAIRVKSNDVVMAVLDLSISRNRAIAARFHAVETPLLVCLSSEGVTISRDDQHLSQKLVLKRIEEARQRGPELDARLIALRETRARNKGNVAAQFELADFLLTHQNSLEAIPELEAIAHSRTNDPMARVRAWVALGRAHIWIGEVEKARHEADGLIATLGDSTPEATAGGNLVHGIQDANGKRTALARKEFEAAIAASPDSVSAKEAKDALAKLPRK